MDERVTLRRKATLGRKFLAALLTTFLLLTLIPPLVALGGQGQWTSNGPDYTHVYSIAVSPNYATDATLFAGTFYYGVYKSTNGGASGTPVNSGLPSSNPNFNPIALSPSYATDATLFVGTDCGVYKSTDGGASWTPVNSGLTYTYVLSIALSPNYATDKTLFAGTFAGVNKSTDGGASWTPLNSGFTYDYIYSIALSPNYANDATLFVGAHYDGVYKSTDGGASWTSVNSGLTGNYINSIALSPNYATDATLFAGTDWGGIYKSTDGGASWTPVNSGLTNPGVLSIALSPNYATDATLFAGVGVYGGVCKSTDGGASWTPVNNGLADTCVTSIAVSPNYSKDGTIFAGTYGAGVYSYSFDVTPPTTTPATNPATPNGTNGWFKSATTVTLTSSEPGATYYQWDTNSGAWTTYTESFNVAEGRHTLYYYSIDEAGNKEATQHKAINLDLTAPVLAVPQDMTLEATGPDGATANFTATAIDNLSTPSISYSKNPGTVFPLGDTTVTVTATDEAGNATVKSFKVRVQDTTPPSAPTSLKATVKATLLLFTQSINLNWSGASDIVGVSSYVVQRSSDGKSWANVATVDAPATSYSDTDIAPLTLYHYRVFAKDAAGNISANASPAALILTLVAVK